MGKSIKKIKTPQEKFIDMNKKNKLLEGLRKEFKLDLI